MSVAVVFRSSKRNSLFCHEIENHYLKMDYENCLIHDDTNEMQRKLRES